MKPVIFITAALSASSIAQTLTPLGSEPGLNWRVGADIAYDDNVYRTAALEETDTYLSVQPELAWFAYSGANQFDVALNADLRRYNDQDVLDYNAWDLRGHALLDHSVRLRTDYQIEYVEGVEAPGINNQVFLPGQPPTEFEQVGGAWTVFYGSTDARGQLQGSVRYSEQEFLNNRQEFRDSNNTQFTGTFLYGIAPRTQLLFQMDYTDFDFTQADVFGNDQSGEQTLYLTGVTWEATANTTGEFKIGYRDRTFESDNFVDLSGLALSLDMTWTPSELTQVTIGAGQENQDAIIPGAGGQVRTGFNVGLSRALGARTALVATAMYDRFEFEGDSGREDERTEFGLGLEYDLLPRVTAGLSYQYEERESGLALFNYTSNAVVISFRFAPPS
ncbi:outer membrane beta-barrel protein [Congregibacter variabilis]|uniref:Outer membrane beta-barrel protein n=1 Tax=Congregibacter variabilis TaxID=3081200 RepID=A0ABZ0I554_9GAMM|nr:outer membrane beta-barrel protein [Congregibacter sp. IMCC43200]